ncbi:MAG: hypothetical protein AB8B92_01270 [Gammaproteobacteria bacterium]
MNIKHIRKRSVGRVMIAMLFLLLTSVSSLHAADMAGRYLISGAGKDSCRSFVDADAVGKSYYRAWLSGYITAHNYYSDSTYSIVNKMTVDELEAWLRGYCFSNMTHTYEQAAKGLMRKLEYFKKKNFYDK